MIVNHFPKIFKSLLKNDYPVLNSCLFVECWLAYTLDNSLTSMPNSFKRINPAGLEVGISTFSKANTHRTQEPFRKIYEQLNQLVPKEAHKKL
jgi:putative transposase